MTRDELQKGIRESFSLVYKKMLFWKYIWHLEKRIAEIEEPILCHKCNDHIDGDGAICGVCASTQDTVINEQRERIAELDSILKAQDAENGDLKIETTVSSSKSLGREERIHQLQSERGHLLRIISLIPADEVLNKRSLEYRLKQVEADLESLLGEDSLLKAQEER